MSFIRTCIAHLLPFVSSFFLFFLSSFRSFFNFLLLTLSTVELAHSCQAIWKSTRLKNSALPVFRGDIANRNERLDPTELCCLLKTNYFHGTRILWAGKNPFPNENWQSMIGSFLHFYLIDFLLINQTYPKFGIIYFFFLNQILIFSTYIHYF